MNTIHAHNRPQLDSPDSPKNVPRMIPSNIRDQTLHMQRNRVASSNRRVCRVEQPKNFSHCPFSKRTIIGSRRHRSTKGWGSTRIVLDCQSRSICNNWPLPVGETQIPPFVYADARVVPQAAYNRRLYPRIVPWLRKTFVWYWWHPLTRNRLWERANGGHSTRSTPYDANRLGIVPLKGVERRR